VVTAPKRQRLQKQAWQALGKPTNALRPRMLPLGKTY
jgi:hypothetical protein